MTTEPTLAMRERYRERDRARTDALVIVSTASATQRRAYHDDPDCQHVRETRTSFITRGEAQARDFWPCRGCILPGPSGGGGAGRETCPLCGDRLDGRGLSTHLPECDGPASGSALPSQGVAD